jgi:hypothetical protein
MNFPLVRHSVLGIVQTCDMYLVRTWHVAPRATHHDQREHCTAVEYPGGETEEVDQRVDGTGTNHGHGYQRLKHTTILLL